jgi:two-component sensor histidine kinase
VVLLPFGVLIASIPSIVDGYPPWEDPQVVAVCILSLVLGGCYALARRGRYQLSAFLAILVSGFAIFAISLLDTNPDNIISDIYFLVAAVLFSSSILSPFGTAFIFVLSALAMLLLPVFIPQVHIENVLKNPLSHMITIYALIVFGDRLRTTLEQHHLDAVKSENRERRRVEQQLRASLLEKEVLLKEIHHRVKNNLQIISSLLSLQAANVHDSTTLAQFRDSQNRVRSMALIHERLYRSDDLAKINFREYIDDLSGHLLQSYLSQDNTVSLKVEAEDIYLDIDTAIPCGLLISELVSNALKHAFPQGRSGTLGIEMKQCDDGQYHVVVRDDGVGIAEDLDFRKTKSLGLKLVHNLARQLGGTVDFQNGRGTEIAVSFPAKEASPTHAIGG